MKNKLILLKGDDWEGLYVNGKLIDEDHKLGESKPEKYWINVANDYNITANDLTVDWLESEDEELVGERGSFPKFLEELSGSYE